MNSWGSGANPWGTDREDQFNKPNHWDGILEVVGVTGVIHLGQIQSGFRNGVRIAQVYIDTYFSFTSFHFRNNCIDLIIFLINRGVT